MNKLSKRRVKEIVTEFRAGDEFTTRDVMDRLDMSMRPSTQEVGAYLRIVPMCYKCTTDTKGCVIWCRK